MNKKTFNISILSLISTLLAGALPHQGNAFAAEIICPVDGNLPASPLGSFPKISAVAGLTAIPSQSVAPNLALPTPFSGVEAAKNDEIQAVKKAPSVQSPSAASSSVRQRVSMAALMQANKEVLSLRDNVWDGSLPPPRFYPEVKQVFIRYFGRNYGSNIRRFLNGQAARRQRSEDVVDFRSMSEAERKIFFTQLPKGADLHIHWTGAGSPNLWMKLWKKFDTKLPTETVANKLRHIGENPKKLGLDLSRPTVSGRETSPELRQALGRSLVSSAYDKTTEDFHSKWQIIRPISKDPRTFYPLLRGMARSAKEQNISYLEGLAPSDSPLVSAVAQAAFEVEKETGIVIRVLANNLWNQKAPDVDSGMKTAHELLGSGVVGFNMVADELKNRPLTHYASFKRLREEFKGLHVTLHSGEVRGSADNIVNNILLGVERYGHATQVLSNPIAMALLYANKTPVEVSLISNLSVKVLNKIADSPMPKMLAWGVPVILSTDDPGIFSSTLSEEYELAQREFDLSLGELKKISFDGILHSFLDETTKQRLLTELSERWQTFEKSEFFLKFKK